MLLFTKTTHMRNHKSAVCILSIVLLLPFITTAQGTLTGTVTSGGRPLENASVTSSKAGGAVTDKDGKYSLRLSAGPHSITFSIIGFTVQTMSVNIVDGQTTVQDVAMEPDVLRLETILVVGTRSLPRSAVGTPLPVDNVDLPTLKSTGQITFDKALQYRVPSFNTVNTPVNDATTLLDPYEIRNLGPSRTLVLINGKRKNLSSLLYVQFSPGRGETGADLSGIPLDAIKNVEILRDGASAQYGSDAIAGVMNITLKDRYDYSHVTLFGGITNKGDGGNYGLSLNSGANIGSRGFINYTVALSQQDNAIRSGNIDIPTELATFGGDATTDDAIRRYLAVYPTGNNENGTGETTAGKYKGYNGYEPTFDGDLIDYNATAGFKTELNGWKQDISITVGGNQQLYSVVNTVNRTLVKASPTAFKPGGYGFFNVIGNIDISKSITDNFAVGFGTEIRKETYKIIAGDTASYSGEGANSFPGIRQENSGTFSRYNMGAYFDASVNVTSNWLIDGTVRGEKYSDFGNAFVYKLSSRVKVSGDNFVF